eukprot:TRINITY_DN79391_c0_g1_i1.p1 TRINITY_DN79391_c0_g1~~TRINITY_DN79391_c0_g1_i1.p1  ORF type:complete len:112 (+),score=9.51 TRINITY_DN79391_c0_g1_i1:25-336(+)
MNVSIVGLVFYEKDNDRKIEVGDVFTIRRDTRFEREDQYQGYSYQVINDEGAVAGKIIAEDEDVITKAIQRVGIARIRIVANTQRRGHPKGKIVGGELQMLYQ